MRQTRLIALKGINRCFYTIMRGRLAPPANGSQSHLAVQDHEFGNYSMRGCMLKGLIMDGCVLLTSTPECVVSPRGETTHEGVDVNNTHPSMINPDYNMILANLTLNYQYFAY